MARFITSFVVKLDIEAEDVHEANRAFYECRKSIMAALRPRLSEDTLRRIRIPPLSGHPCNEIIEVDEVWLENDKRRRKFQQEWEYETREAPIVAGSKTMLTHKVALGPKEQPEPQTG